MASNSSKLRNDKKCVWKTHLDSIQFESDHFSGYIDSDVVAAANNAFAASDTPGKKLSATCDTLEQIMDDRNITQVDLVSLDIEGAEIETLGAFPFDKYDIRVWLVETVWLSHPEIDRLFLRNGYVKAAHLPLDSVYVKRSTTKLWYPPKMISKFYPQNKKFMADLERKCFEEKTLEKCFLAQET